jgi:methyltransferase (TIGR00027 family)
MVTVSDTAYAIAIVRSEESARPAEERLFEDPYAAIFAAGGEHAAEATQRLLDLPFVRDGVRLRTRFGDDAVRESLASGLTQIVLFGAGFDARALRMPEITARGARVYEVDFAALLDRKRALLGAAGVTLPAHVACVACDFVDPDFDLTLREAMAASGFRLGQGALFVWEGVIPYIDDAAVHRSLAFMSRAGGPNTRVVFDFSEVRFDPVPAAERVRRAGFTTFTDVASSELWSRHLKGEPHPAAVIMRMGTAIV